MKSVFAAQISTYRESSVILNMIYVNVFHITKLIITLSSKYHDQDSTVLAVGSDIYDGYQGLRQTQDQLFRHQCVLDTLQADESQGLSA